MGMHPASTFHLVELLCKAVAIALSWCRLHRLR